MVLRVPLLFEGSKNSRHLYALFDSVATYSCINEDIAEDLEIFTPFCRPLKLSTANEHASMIIKNAVILDFYKNDIRLSDEFLIVSGLSEEVIIGSATIRKWRIKLDFENDTILVNPQPIPILINLLEN